jgi:hypothetical protein
MINVNQHRRTLYRTRRITTNTEIQHMHLCSHQSAINTDQWSQIRSSVLLSKRDKYDQSCLLQRPLPDLSAKEYQSLYKREYLKNQPLSNGPWFKEYKLCIPLVIQRINPFKKALDSRPLRILLPHLPPNSLLPYSQQPSYKQPFSSNPFLSTLYTNISKSAKPQDNRYAWITDNIQVKVDASIFRPIKIGLYIK